MVVDFVNIGTGRWSFWPYILICDLQKDTYLQPPIWVVCVFWWETACINRAENKQEFSDLMKQVKEFKEKYTITPDCEF